MHHILKRTLTIGMKRLTVNDNSGLKLWEREEKDKGVLSSHSEMALERNCESL